MRFTEASIRKIKPIIGKRQHIKDDLTIGLYLRIYEGSGRKVFVYRYTTQGKTKWMTLGDIEQITLVEARKKASEHRLSILKGEDPAADFQKQKAILRAMPTIEAFADEYMEIHAMRNKRDWKGDLSMLNNWVIPYIGKLKISSVTRRDVVEIIDIIETSGKKRMPSKVLSLLKKYFNFAIQRGLIEISPCTHIHATQPLSQTTALNKEQIKVLWEWSFDDKNHLSTRLALRLLLLTGQRPGEIGGITFDEINFEEKSWHLPPSRRKRGGNTHIVPFSRLAMDTIQEAVDLSVSDTWLFPNNRNSGGIKPDSTMNTYLKKLFPGEGITPHSIRRTVATELSDNLNINIEIISRVLGHYPKTITSQYIKRSENSARAALDSWAEYLQNLSSKNTHSNVITLRSK